MERRIRPVALTIAGSDSGGGAGVEADLKTFAALGVHGAAAVTAVTAQNTLGVQAVHLIPPGLVAAQIRAVAEDMGVDAAKTGMLGSAETILEVARVLESYDFPLVVDPVTAAESDGTRLMPDRALEALREKLLPRAALVTPNALEAEMLTGIRITSIEEARRAAKLLVEEYGAEAALVKGGHLGGRESIDVLYHRGGFHEYRAPRLSHGCSHGTGCTLSAAITAELAKGRPLEEAVRTAKSLVTAAIEYAARLGRGACPVNPVAALEMDAWRWRVARSVERASSMILQAESLVAPHVPEVGTNVVEALPAPYARSREDVAGILGRIVRTPRGLRAGPVAFGASDHLARLVLEVMKYTPWIRSVINIRYSPELVEAARKLGYRVARIDRAAEPPETRTAEGGTMKWIARSVFPHSPADLVYDEGDWGKEPMIRIFAGTAVEAARKLLKILERASHS
ncbi:phosphomethylpyrimidine kinase [Pyrodictium occultum]|uniref:Phosphomethylpyrimidine kinase n=1 Tax=Pyrodictium occultum TaxID=2309 RepID=A0A0V8RX03_PYROC|nr:bifunctional hydroxymethylpyrimidine kinase/phosphomethylpyrimidine kinase [Pyrodictium occultum]KSW12564.1 phosphomethylpyrimidine kinase [Pyrodictium occultum]